MIKEKEFQKAEILYIGGFSLPDKNAAAHRVLNNARAFRKLGLNTIFVDVDKSLNPKNIFFDNYKEVDGFKCFSISYSNNPISLIKELVSIKVFKEMIKKFPDIKYIICYNYQSIALYRLNKLCKKKGIKIISDCTEGYYFDKNSGLISLAKAFDDYFRVKYVQPRLDGLILISKTALRYCRKASNTITIPPLVDKTEKKWGKHIIQYNKDTSSKINLIYAGNLGSNKDKIFNLLDYLANVNDSSRFKFSIIGIKKNEFVKKYPEFNTKLERLKEVVFFLGKMNNTNVIMELQKSDFLIFYREKTIISEIGFPTKFVESISAGIPVITNNTSDIKLYLMNGTNGFLIESDNLEDELNKIFSKPNNKLKDIKINIDRNVFDYNNYLENISKFFECIGK